MTMAEKGAKGELRELFSLHGKKEEERKMTLGPSLALTALDQSSTIPDPTDVKSKKRERKKFQV